MRKYTLFERIQRSRNSHVTRKNSDDMIYHIGYAQRGSAQEIERLLLQEKTYLLDIRYRPWSNQSQWRKEILQDKYQKKYIHVKALGNINYKHHEKGIELFCPDSAIQKIQLLMKRGYSFILLCGCLNYETCHRKVVYELLTCP